MAQQEKEIVVVFLAVDQGISVSGRYFDAPRLVSQLSDTTHAIRCVLSSAVTQFILTGGTWSRLKFLWRRVSSVASARIVSSRYLIDIAGVPDRIR